MSIAELVWEIEKKNNPFGRWNGWCLGWAIHFENQPERKKFWINQAIEYALSGRMKEK